MTGRTDTALRMREGTMRAQRPGESSADAGEALDEGEG